MTHALPDPSQLEVSQLTIYLSHACILLPPNEREKFRYATGQQVFKSRCYSEHEQHPNYMAQYGSQQGINRSQLEHKGLYAHFFMMDNGKIRFLHPCDISMMHVHWDAISVSSNIHDGWLHVGSMISIPHALLLLGNTMKIVFQDLNCPSVEQMFEDLLKQAMQQNHIRQFSGRHATMFIDQRSPNLRNNWDLMLGHFDQLVDFHPCTNSDKMDFLIQEMQRFWQIGQVCSPFFRARSGCPEGDSLSVVAMICIAWLWVEGTSCIDDEMGSTSFADNWTWWASDPTFHTPAFRHTVTFTGEMGLEIDWQKTWRWKTSDTHAVCFKNIIVQFVPSGKWELMTNAWDLGTPIAYKAMCRLGKMKLRFDKAKAG